MKLDKETVSRSGGEKVGLSDESFGNFLDEGLGNSLDGTDKISYTSRSLLGRNDSGIFSNDEAIVSQKLDDKNTKANTEPTNGQFKPTQKKHRSKNSSPSRSGPQQCVVCGKIFSNASALTKHKLTHSDERKHICSICGKAFKRQDHLNGHLLTHRNKKPFECTAKGCGKSYCDARSLRRHMESRHAIKSPINGFNVKRTYTTTTTTLAKQSDKKAKNAVVNAQTDIVSHPPTNNSPSFTTLNILDCEPLELLNSDSNLLSAGRLVQMDSLFPSKSINMSKSQDDIELVKTNPNKTADLCSVNVVPVKNDGICGIELPCQGQQRDPLFGNHSPTNYDLDVISEATDFKSWLPDEDLDLSLTRTNVLEKLELDPQLPEASSLNAKAKVDTLQKLMYHEEIMGNEIKSVSTPEIVMGDISDQCRESSNSFCKDTCDPKRDQTNTPISGVTNKLPTSVSTPTEEKPVECSICCRRFKNTPALNGHMRLHGGYFKKDADGKKKDPSGKDVSSYPPLQTASISVRALIEEKIIQKRNIQGFLEKKSFESQLSNSATKESSSEPLEPPGLHKSSGSLSSLTSSSEGGLSDYPTDVSFLHEDLETDFVMMEDELFSKVSSICPDSFLKGIDESIFKEASSVFSDSRDSSNQWNWGLCDEVDPNSQSNFQTYGAAQHRGILNNTITSNSQRLLSHADSLFYSTSSSQSPNNIQDSPTFTYPTPPASLESHNNTLQSPIAPFPPGSLNSTNFVNFPSNIFRTSANDCLNVPSGDPHIKLEDGHLHSSSTMINKPSLSLPPTSLQHSSTVNGFISPGNSVYGEKRHMTQFDTSLHKLPTFNNGPVSNGMGVETIPNVLTPSSSPVLPHQSYENSKGRKINGSAASGLNPTSAVTKRVVKRSSSQNSMKIIKRKLLRNTFASNLRPQSSSSSHYTPYPILSPVRSAPGLYWSFATTLTHIVDSKKNLPRINIGKKFQAEIPEVIEKVTSNSFKYADHIDEEDDLLWRPEIDEQLSPEQMDSYLEFSCCAAVPGGGRNKEYALHLLNLCNGDIKEAMMKLMNPNPRLPLHLRRYNHSDVDKWSPMQLKAFEAALVRHGKDFSVVANAVPGKAREECTMFYHLWKKVFPKEYERSKSVWKKRDALFTVDLLKAVPPPMYQENGTLINDSSSPEALAQFKLLKGF